MILSRRVALNGVQLDEVNEAIAIRSVEPADGKETISATGAAAGYGQRVTGYRRDTVDMVVKFAIDIRKDDLAGRAAVLEAVNAWAAAAAPERGGAYMTVNYKPERRLFVKLAQAPGEGSLWDWTKDFTITFRAYEIPYWEDESQRNVRIGSGSSTGSGSFQVDGSVKTPIEAELLNRSGMVINSATVSVGGKSMAFSSMALAANEALVIDHTNDGLLRIRIRSAGGSYRSAMDKRSSASADDFPVLPGIVSASYVAQRACRMTLFWRCRYL